MKSNLFAFVIDIDDFIQYIIENCDNEDYCYTDIDISGILLEYMEDKEILYKGNSKFNGNSFYNYIDDVLRYKQENKDILNDIEYYKNKIIELENKLK